MTLHATTPEQNPGATAEVHPAARGRISARAAAASLLALALVLGAWLRFSGLDWDAGRLLHPDERSMLWVVQDMQPVDSIAAYFDTPTSTLNPHNVRHEFYVYGDLPILALKAIGEGADASTMYDLRIPGRRLAAAADLAVVLLIFLVAREMFADHRIAALAATLYATAALPLQLARFFTADPFTNVFALAASWFAVRSLRRHRWLDYPLFGLFLALAMASKLSIAPLAGVLVAAVAIRVWREGEDPARAGRAMREAAAGLALAGVVTLLVFRVAMPYAFLPPGTGITIDREQLGPGLAVISRLAEPFGFRPNPAWLANMQEVGRWVGGEVDAPPNHQWAHRIPWLFPLGNILRAGLGWPLGLAAWGALVWAIVEAARGARHRAALGLAAGWALLVFVWQGSGWVTTMRYFLPIYPHLIMLAAWGVVTAWDRASALVAARAAPPRHPARLITGALGAALVLGGVLWGFAVWQIWQRPHTRVAATDWMLENVPADATLVFDTPDGRRTLQLALPNVWPVPDPALEDPTRPTVQYSYLYPSELASLPFTPPFDGTLVEIRFNRILDPLQLDETHTLQVSLQRGAETLFAGQVAGTYLPVEDGRGEPASLAAPSVPVEAGVSYALTVQPDDTGPLVLAGATIAPEGEWDDPVPIDGWGLHYQPLNFNLAWDDTPDKRARMQYVLDHADYLTISSNRFYDSLRRNPQRWPMTLDYYDALFAGELGFELVADFASRPTLGPLEFVDDGADEAWTVYDHPRVMIFRKTAAYSPARTAAVLGQADLASTVGVIARDAPGRPRRLDLPPRQPTGEPVVPGTGVSAAAVEPAPAAPPAQTFYERAQLLTVLLWWLLIGVIGWAAFPLLWAALPGLPGRGLALSRSFGLLFSAWLSWLLASARVLPWGRGSILLALGALVAASAALAWPRRAELAGWLAARRRHVMLVEAGMAALFAVSVLVRLANPDLWHPIFGGEKPMDLAYLNAVLRSGHFPPYDPWFAGETINYYYFGFVIAGVPFMLLGLPVALGYNLAVPTLFALTGAGAFAAAFNLTAPLPRPDDAAPRFPLRTYAAGLAALLLAVGLGNLDQIRTLLWGLAELGAGEPSWTVTLLPPIGDTLRGLATVLRSNAVLPVAVGEWYWNATRVVFSPLGPDGLPIDPNGLITEFPLFTFLYADLHAHMIALPLTLLVLNWTVAHVRGAVHGPRQRLGTQAAAGVVIVLAAGALRATNTWDYPTYLLVALCGVLLAAFYRRAAAAALPALGAGAVAAGLVGGAFYAFSAAAGGSILAAGAGAGLGFGLGFVVGLAGLSPERRQGAARSLGEGLLAAAAITAGTVVAFLPYIRNYELGYGTIVPWSGWTTPLWAYLDVHGLFLFVIASWLVVELGGWLRGGLRGLARRRLVPLVVAAAVLAGVTALAASWLSPPAWVGVPLLAAALLIFFRPALPAEKRLIAITSALALALTLAVEAVVLKDDLGRMNTVFKFYVQVWVLLAISAGAAAAWLWEPIRRAREAVRTTWLAALGVLVTLAAMYPLTAVPAKMNDRWDPTSPPTLDGMAYMRTVSFAEYGTAFGLAGDYAAIRWLRENVEGTPTVLEGLSAREYLWGNRISVYTGLPSVVGWNWHQRQQRPPRAVEVWQRHLDVRTLYDTIDTGVARALLEQYGVDLIVVGGLERALYQPAGLAKFEQMAAAGLLETIYQQGDTVIYRVTPAHSEGS